MGLSAVSPADLNPSQLIHLVAAFLEQQGIRYRVVGSLASMAYGEPRFTNDIDFLADIRLDHATTFLQAFPPPELYLSEAAIDRGYIDSWSVRLGVLAEWQALLADLAE